MAKKIIFITALITFFLNTASAEELDSFYRGIRPLSMGDAFTAIADDENAAFYNPAGLASIKSGRVELINPLLEASQNVINAASDLTSIKTTDIASTTDILKKYIGPRQHMRFSLFPNYTRHNFELGILGQGRFDGEIHSPSYPYVELDAGADVGGVLALARGFMEDRLQLGITGIFAYRSGIAKKYTAADIATQKFGDFDKALKPGSAIGVNAGLIYNFDRAFEPSVGISLLNIGDMSFGEDKGKVKQQLNAGIALHKPFWIINSTVALDYKDILGNASNDTDMGKRLHMGAEFKFPKVLSFRGGINQGYFTYGLGIDLWLIKLSYARYKEEIGAYAGQKFDDRHVVQLSLGW